MRLKDTGKCHREGTINSLSPSSISALAPHFFKRNYFYGKKPVLPSAQGTRCFSQSIHHFLCRLCSSLPPSVPAGLELRSAVSHSGRLCCRRRRGQPPVSLSHSTACGCDCNKTSRPWQRLLHRAWLGSTAFDSRKWLSVF